MAGRAAAQVLWDMAEEAKALVAGLIETHAMAGVDPRPGVATACRKAGAVGPLHAYAERLARDYGYDQWEPLDRAGIRDLIGSQAFQGGGIDWGAGHIHPLNFCLGLAKAAMAAGVTIHERAEVTQIVHGGKPVVQTAQGSVVCDQVILACNGYLSGLAPEVEARVMPINTFIIATEPLGERALQVLSQPVAVYDTRFMVNYWRLSGDGRLLFGGGESYGYRFPKDIAGLVRKPMLAIYPQLRGVKIDHAWGGTLAITRTRMPCFRRVAGNVMAASACSGHGVALSTLAGKIMAQAVRGQAEGFDLMASLPQPRFPGGVAGRWPMLVLAMTWYGMRDRLGI